MDVNRFWSDILAQRADEIREYFHADAYVNWHCSNEHYTVEEFIRANCDYPGDWDGEVEKVVTMDDMIITATVTWYIRQGLPKVKNGQKSCMTNGLNITEKNFCLSI